MALAISFGFFLLLHFVYVEIQNGAPLRLTLPGKLARNCCRRQAPYVLPTERSMSTTCDSLQVLVLLIFQSHGLIPDIQRGRDFAIFFSALLLFFSTCPPDCFRWVQKKGNLTYAASSIEKSRHVFLLSLQVKSLSFLL